MTPDRQSLLRSIPSMSALLERPEVREWFDDTPRPAVVEAIQTVIERTRRGILSGALHTVPDADVLLTEAERELAARSLSSLRKVINATGIVLHTGLGRAPLSDAAIEAIVETAHGYCNLEYDLQIGARGHRGTQVSELLSSLTAAEAALVVNNNAAATLLILNTFAAGREVIVSRGQLIEIGGSYRLPDIMAASGAVLREVGTTNRTRISDYEQAICDRTAMLLRVHPSNYRVVGFAEETDIAALAALAKRFGLTTVDDMGSGALLDFAAHGLPAEPSVAASLSSGADLACFSGDKLVGGPQCGIIVGSSRLIERIAASPLTRTYRVDKLVLAALEATLRAYFDPEEAVRTIPTLAMLGASADELAARARRLHEQLTAALPDEHFFVCSDVGYAGGGSMPTQELQTVVVQWRPEHASASDVATALRLGETSVVARIRDDAICFDLRTVDERDFDPLVATVCDAIWDHDGEESPGDGSIPLRIL